MGASDGYGYGYHVVTSIIVSLLKKGVFIACSRSGESAHNVNKNPGEGKSNDRDMVKRCCRRHLIRVAHHMTGVAELKHASHTTSHIGPPKIPP